jgi:hypothetical protein
LKRRTSLKNDYPGEQGNGVIGFHILRFNMERAYLNISERNLIFGSACFNKRQVWCV